MVPFHQICPKLAAAECRTLYFQDPARPGESASEQYALFESYCTDQHCDCRRVILNVATAKRIEATISFGFDADDPDRGPFLDPLNKQGKDARHLLSFVEKYVLNDPEYVARLERHYTITKDIAAGRLRPEDALPSVRIEQPIELTDWSSRNSTVDEDSIIESERELPPFDIGQVIFDEYGESDEGECEEYANALTERFARSSEALPLLERDFDICWAQTFLHYAIRHLGMTPPQLSASDVEEVLFEIMPRKVSVSADEAEEIVTVLRAFWEFLGREFRLPNAREILQRLGSGATERLHDALDDPANFGMAKSFFMAGQKAGFDMRTQQGLTAFALAYNSSLQANNRAMRGSIADAQSRRLSIFEDNDAAGPFATRSERRAAERAKLREEKKRNRQAKRKNRR